MTTPTITEVECTYKREDTDTTRCDNVAVYESVKPCSCPPAFLCIEHGDRVRRHLVRSGVSCHSCGKRVTGLSSIRNPA